MAVVAAILLQYQTLSAWRKIPARLPALDQDGSWFKCKLSRREPFFTKMNLGFAIADCSLKILSLSIILLNITFFGSENEMKCSVSEIFRQSEYSWLSEPWRGASNARNETLALESLYGGQITLSESVDKTKRFFPPPTAPQLL